MQIVFVPKFENVTAFCQNFVISCGQARAQLFNEVEISIQKFAIKKHYIFYSLLSQSKTVECNFLVLNITVYASRSW